ncbi:S-layer homology domain-containing protein [Butyricicoccus faecihominis]|uniref:S-layer homology domain-containing protein n=1 Tax=Butyricicoccus faecihominis TaxID=1712515 RepID=UPI00247A55E6|nr:S-layer homology domain-containing protein [Butyricicoccus faecihominis]MCQ5130186.1 S-layer homology domain-containing protein [Butyricicoccus faecihominis]
MIQKRIKRASAYLLVICLLFSFFPVKATAVDDPDQAGNNTLLNSINQKGGAGSAEIDPATGHVKLLRDVQLQSSITVFRYSATLDLNGYKLAHDTSYAIYVTGDYRLSLLDAKGTGQVKGGGSTFKAVLVQAGAELVVNNCTISGGINIDQRSILEVTGPFQTDAFFGQGTIRIHNGQTLDLSGLDGSTMSFGERLVELAPLGAGETWDTATPLIKTGPYVLKDAFIMEDPPEGYFMSYAAQSGLQTWTLTKKLPDSLKVSYSLPEHVSASELPSQVPYGGTLTVVLQPQEGYAVTEGNIHVWNAADLTGAELPKQYDPNTRTLTVEQVKTDLKIRILEKIQLTYDTDPAGGTLTVIGINGAPIAADKLVAPNAQIRITATPDEGYALASLTVNGQPFASSDTYTVTEPLAIIAEFEVSEQPPAYPTVPDQKVKSGMLYAGYQTLLSATGGAPLHWSVSNEEGNRLPNGLRLDPATGALSGMPEESGTFLFTVTVTNAVGSASKQLSILINQRDVPPVTGGSSGTSGAKVSAVTGTPTADDPNPPTVGEVTPTARVDQAGKVRVTITDRDIQNAIDKALAQAKKDGAQENGIAVSIDLTGLKTVFHTLPLTLSKTAYGKLVDAGVRYLSIRTPQISLTIDLAALQTIYDAASGDVTIDATKAESLPEALRDRPAYDLTATSGGKLISSFGGNVDIALPYTPQSGERSSDLRMAWVETDGTVRHLAGSQYDGNAKAVLGQTNHFTVFGITDYPEFTDIKGHWAEDDILFVASQGLLIGTGKTVFTPEGTITRGMFVTALYRLAGSPQSDSAGKAFADVSANAYYTDAVRWAAAQGIVRGGSDGLFRPDESVTREQLAVMLDGYAGKMDYTVSAVQDETAYADASLISAWARQAITEMQRAGIMQGKPGGKFDPQGTATRAEAAAVLRRFIETVTDGQ